eukprot:scaffold68326_cov75-Phaeocystis_antarctica.AAC.2
MFCVCLFGCRCCNLVGLWLMWLHICTPLHSTPLLILSLGANQKTKTYNIDEGQVWRQRCSPKAALLHRKPPMGSSPQSSAAPPPLRVRAGRPGATRPAPTVGG